MGVEAVKKDTGDIVEPDNKAAVMPGVAALPGRLLDPPRQDAPVCKTLPGTDQGQPDVTGWGGIGVRRLPLADLPGLAAQGLQVGGGRSLGPLGGQELRAWRLEVEKGKAWKSIRESRHFGRLA